MSIRTALQTAIYTTLICKRTKHCGQLGFTLHGSRIENNRSYSVTKNGEKFVPIATIVIIDILKEMSIQHMNNTSAYRRDEGVLFEVLVY
jgi:hypothetical protein